MATWPATLPPTFDSEGLEVQEPDVLIESQPELGPPIVRRRTTAAPERIAGTIILDQTQTAAFKAFLRTTLMGGALPFDGFTHPVDRTPIPKAAIVTGSVRYGVRNPYATVQFTLLVLP